MGTEGMLDVLVVGAGQVGLAAGHHLARAGLRFRLLERSARVGDAWRQRYDSLVLFTPRRYSALPERPLAGDPAGYPTKDEVADYLEAYARAFDLPVETGTDLVHLARERGAFTARTSRGETVRAKAVVVAAGAFQVPVVPAFAAALGPDVARFDVATYRHPGQLPRGRVLVAGDGASGRQIALELSRAGGGAREVVLAGGRPRPLVPQRLLGRDLFWWLDLTGAVRADRDSPVGRWLRARDPIPGKTSLGARSLRRAGVRLVGRVTGATAGAVEIAGGERLGVDAVVWALGYRDDTSWLRVDGAVAAGRVVETRGVSPVPGLFFAGRSWQHDRASALLLGADAEGRRVTARVVAHLRTAEAGGRWSAAA